MDTVKTLLVLTIALLVGALGWSLKGFRSDTRATPPEKLAEVRREIAEIRVQREALATERQRLLAGEPLRPTAAPAAETALPTEISAAEAAAVEDTGAVFGDLPPMPGSGTPAPAGQGTAPAAPEAPAAPTMGSAERAEAIKSAPVVAKIAEWIDNPDLGSFATLEVADPVAVKRGTVLCIRRGSGILGRLQANVTEDGVLADPLTQFGEMKPQAGDELILEPAAAE